MSLVHSPSAHTQPVADGWVLVPIEPTDAMLQDGCPKHAPGQPMSDRPGGDRECPAFSRRRRIWADMVAKAEGCAP